MVTRTTRVTTTGVAVHTISFRGIAGAIFMLIMLALVLYVIGFSTTAWTVYGDLTSSHDQHGLWQSCRCGTRGKEGKYSIFKTVWLNSMIFYFLLYYFPFFWRRGGEGSSLVDFIPFGTFGTFGDS